MADDVRSVLRYTTDPKLFDAGHEAATALGVSTEGLKPPPGSVWAKPPERTAKR
jgi:hypothetical protein